MTMTENREATDQRRPPMELRFIWRSWEYCAVTLDGQFVTVMNSDVYGPGEMRSVELALMSAAGIAGWRVVVEGDDRLPANRWITNHKSP